METTVRAISGLLAKLAYFVRLRGPDGSFLHWGVERMYGCETAREAMRAGYQLTLDDLLRTPIPLVWKEFDSVDVETLQMIRKLLIEDPGHGPRHRREHISSIVALLESDPRLKDRGEPASDAKNLIR